MRRRVAREAHLVEVHWRAAADRSDDRRAIGLVAIRPDAAPLQFRGVDAFERAGEAMHEMTARLLAVGDDVDAGSLLFEERDAHGIALRLAQFVAGESPSGPKPFGIR